MDAQNNIKLHNEKVITPLQFLLAKEPICFPREQRSGIRQPKKELDDH